MLNQLAGQNVLYFLQKLRHIKIKFAVFEFNVSIEIEALNIKRTIAVPTEYVLRRSAGARGTCRVMCFSPKSNVTLPLMSVPEIQAVIDTWIEEMIRLGAKYRSVPKIQQLLALTVRR